jgi:hypothetical protein
MPVCGIALSQIVAASPICPVMGQAHTSDGSVVAKSAANVSTIQKEFCHFFIFKSLYDCLLQPFRQTCLNV